MRLQPVVSSAIVLIGYDVGGELLVEYVGGARYVYAGVPEAVFAALLSSSSKGRFVNEVIKRGYSYRRLWR